MVGHAMTRRISLHAWFLVHKWTSLVCTAFLLLICVTGLPLVFSDEIDAWLEPHAMGLMALLFVIALVSGAVLYTPFMRKLDFGTIRRDRSARLKWLDWHIVILVTGFYLWIARRKARD
jgi:uncharacterized iron-regulated membrane protein